MRLLLLLLLGREKGLDELIEYLLTEIAFSGSRGRLSQALSKLSLRIT